MRRTAQAALVVLLVTVVVFLLLQALPGGPARGILGQTATPAQIKAFNESHGFNDPIYQQYFAYLGRLLHGNLGESFVLNMPVSEAIAHRLPKTILLTVLSLLVALAIALPLGVWQASRRNSTADYTTTTFAVILYSTPIFFLGLILIMLFSQWLGWLPALAPQGNSLLQIIQQPKSLILPVLTGALVSIAAFSRYARSSTLDNLSQDYVRTARAKGTSESAVLRRHVVRNSLTPVIALLGYQIPVLFGGALVVEQLFNYPGMGLLFWAAAQSGDFPVLLGCVLIIAIATVVGSLLADLLQAALDPRTRGAVT